MKSFKWDTLQSIKATAENILGNDNPILLEFDIVPFDYEVKDIFTCKLYISMNFLVLIIDDIIEVYDLKILHFYYLGSKPKLLLWEQFLEPSLSLEEKMFPLSKSGYVPDDFFRFLISEDGVTYKQFALRNGKKTSKAFQTWAMVETIKKLRLDDEDADLHNMIYGNFSSFNPLVFAFAFVVFFVYVFISVVLGSILPDFIKLFFDSVFILLCILFVGWIFKTMYDNTKKHAKIYERYGGK